MFENSVSKKPVFIENFSNIPTFHFPNEEEWVQDQSDETNLIQSPDEILSVIDNFSDGFLSDRIGCRHNQVQNKIEEFEQTPQVDLYERMYNNMEDNKEIQEQEYFDQYQKESNLGEQIRSIIDFEHDLDEDTLFREDKSFKGNIPLILEEDKDHSQGTSEEADSTPVSSGSAPTTPSTEDTNEDFNTPKSGTTPKGPTARKGAYSEHLFRKDSVVKKGLRGGNHLIKTYFVEQIDLHKKEFNKDLRNDSKALREFLEAHITENFSSSLRELYGCELTPEIHRILFSVIAFLIKGKRFFQKFISAKFQRFEGAAIKTAAKEYMKFNDPKRGSGAARDFALNSPVISLAKILIMKNEKNQEIFWGKVFGRKGTSVPNICLLKTKIAESLNLDI